MTTQSISQRKKWITPSRVIFALVILCIAGLQIGSLIRYPAPHVDEAWLTSRAWAFIQTGHQMGPLDLGVVEQWNDYWILNQWLITALQSIILRLAGEPNFIVLRIFSLLLGTGLLLVTYWMAHSWKGKRMAAISTGLLSVSLAFSYSAHLVRYDILAALFCYTALALLVTDKEMTPFRALAAGLLLGLALETHLNSLIFYPVCGLIFILRLKRRFLVARQFWGFIIGCTAGGLYFLLLRVLPNPATFFDVNRLLFSGTHQPLLLAFDAGRLINELSTAAGLILVASGSMIFFIPMAVYQILQQKDQPGFEILAINSLLFLEAVFIIPNKSGNYAIYLAPAFLWLIAYFLDHSVQKKWHGKWMEFVERILILSCVLGFLGLSLPPLFQDGYTIYQKAQTDIQAVVQPEDVVMGTQVYWLGLNDHPYYSWELLFRYPRLFPDMDLEDAFEHFHPDVLIIDQNMDDLITDHLDPSSRWVNYHLPREAFYAYLTTHADLVLHTRDANGPVQVYRLRWK